MREEIEKMLEINTEREDAMFSPFNPITGEGSIGERFTYVIPDYPLYTQWLPIQMKEVPLVKKLQQAGTMQEFIRRTFHRKNTADEEYQATYNAIVEQFVRIRCKHDFPFWAATYIMIKNKGGGADVLFRLNRPQRRLVTRFEEMRLADKPIRLILLKARQWGGSTVTQMYMMWLQLVHKVGLNSLIIAHQGSASDEVKAMFDRAIKDYPVEMMYDIGEDFDPSQSKLKGVGRSGSIHHVPQRNCNIKIGTAERPDSCRGGDYNLVHLSEVGMWKTTEGKQPADIVRSACGGVLYKPYTMIIYESTANGTGNFFHTEYNEAKNGMSQFEALFISWFEIELYQVDFDSRGEKVDFAMWLYDNRKSEYRASNRHTTGKYLWWLWEKGASLESINWYVSERAKYSSDEQMMAEFPTDDIEAFVHSGAKVFDKYKIDAMRVSCRPPMLVGDVYGDRDDGVEALSHVRFKEDSQGLFWIWNEPEIDPVEKVLNRYLVVVDVGGRSHKADWSVIVVFDRLFMMDGEKPMVVAQWYGHIDMDLLAWKATQIATFYDNALLVIESNTLETHERDREVDGDQSTFILSQVKDVYDNLYARKQSEDSILNGDPVRYGFHTNMATKPMIISTLVKVIRENLYIERDERCLDEYNTYEKRQNGSFGAILGKHDDLLMTRAIGLHICFFEMDMPKIVSIEHFQYKSNYSKRPISAATF